MAVHIYAHVDDLEIFGGAARRPLDRLYIAASPMRVDHHIVMSRQGLMKAGCWGFTSEHAWVNWYLKPEMREQVYTYQNILDKVRRVMWDEYHYLEEDTFYTHNPWGEYGHIHHRRVSDAVCEIALTLGATVKSSASQIAIPDGPWTMAETGLQRESRKYPRDEYNKIRNLYQEVEGRMPSKLWTWSETLPPPEAQWIITLVDIGIDRRNADVRYLVESTPTYGLPS